MAHYIYIIENTFNEKRYVGQTQNPEKRERQQLGMTHRRCPLLCQALERYGPEIFEFVLLEKCQTQEETNAQEKYWIKELETLAPNGYNLTEGGEGVGTLSAEAHKKMSIAAKRKTFSPKHRASLSKAKSGRNNPFYGKKHSEESRLKMNIAASERIARAKEGKK